jgi:hypothetical protein
VNCEIAGLIALRIATRKQDVLLIDSSDVLFQFHSAAGLDEYGAEEFELKLLSLN